MSIYNIIVETYSELVTSGENNDFGMNGCIELRDDGDGIQYIARWDYDKPIPEGLKLGK